MSPFVEDGKAEESNAAAYNRRVLRKVQMIAERDPEIDLLSKFPRDYPNALKRRKQSEDGDGVTTSQAVLYNQMVLARLQKLHEKDPESNVLSQIPSSYVEDLEERKGASWKQMNGHVEIVLPKVPNAPTISDGYAENDIRFGMSSLGTAQVSDPLASELLGRMKVEEEENSEHLTKHLVESAKHWKMIFAGVNSRVQAVFRYDDDLAVKVVRDIDDMTEYTTLKYLEKHAPSVPAPRPLGVISLANLTFMFMSYIPGETLSSVWEKLNKDQKASTRHQLDRILLQMRSLPFESGTPLGGVGGGGCKDARRQLRKGTEPITTLQGFEDFQFSNPHYGSPVYIRLLRRLAPSSSSFKCVFTHGDLRPDNIVVQMGEATHDDIAISGIIDWEFGGFYPEFYESTKITNCMAPQDKTDWYEYLPPCITPDKYPTSWLLDRLWWKHIA